MENKDTVIKLSIGVIIIMVLVIISLNKPNEISYSKITICKEDSLQNVINDLQIELESEEDGFDKKEQRYEDILFEYEYGIEHLKETHPSAYKEFHRIISFKERYNIEDKNENQKRLKF